MRTTHSSQTETENAESSAAYAERVEALASRYAESGQLEAAELIKRAYRFAAQAHEGQVREGGEPFVVHPVRVAEILASLEMDPATITAALLHDVVEDTPRTLEDVRAEFGDEVADLVDGVTKLTLEDLEARLGPGEDIPKKRSAAEARRRADNLRKILLAMARDVRVMIVKLADRLHNMQTLSARPREAQIKVASETLSVYAPLAHRLGIWALKWQLEDLAFKILHPVEFEDVAEKVARTRREREQDIEEVTSILQERLKQVGIEGMIQGRPKHLYSIYQKMLRQDVDFSEIYDLTAIRIIVHTKDECYQALGIVHDLWVPIPGKFADYIAHPKPNMYQSLHTKVIGPRGEPLEIQIRTFEMHRIADFGVAAHWRYKEGGKALDTFEQKLSWLRQQMFDWSSDLRDAGEFLRTVTDDLFADQVFAFTPKGRVIDLPAGSTPVDFAYRVHSEIGHTCVGAKVNGRIVPLSYTLKNGDVVEILHRPGASPSFDWLSFVKSAHARGKIKAWFRKLRRQENIVRGRELLEREAQRLGLSPAEALRDDELKRVAPTFNLAESEDLMAAVGAGTIASSTVLKRLRETVQKQQVLPEVAAPAADGRLNIAPGGVDQILVRRSRCCMPLPGDEVSGYVSRGRGMVLHRSNCRNLEAYRQREPERVLDVHWPSGGAEKFHSRIKVEAMDRVGLLNDVSAVFSENHVNIRAARVSPRPDRTTDLDLTVDVADVHQLQTLMVNVSKVPDVLRVYRAGDGERKRNSGGAL